jgi:hypothetical protein
MGLGGNSAIESVAIISNCLKRTLDKNLGEVNAKQIDECLKLFQTEGHKRIKTVFNRAVNATRMQAMDSLSKIIMGRAILCPGLEIN